MAQLNTKTESLRVAVYDYLLRLHYNDFKQEIIEEDIFKQKNGNWLFNGISSYFQNAATYGSHGVKDDPTRKFDNFFGGTVHKKLTAAFQVLPLVH